MRSFAEVEGELGLKRFLASPMGTLYFGGHTGRAPRLMVRRFDAEAPPALAPAYAEIVEYAHGWLEERPHLARLVRVVPPIEVGSDFVARDFHVYDARTSAYSDSDHPMEPPEELNQMRGIFREEAGRSDDRRDRIVERVLARSILEPSGKTYPDEARDGSGGIQFVIVDLKLTLQDLEEWAAIPRRRW
jgi:hypothetical protein